MSKENLFRGKMDPEIAALLGAAAKPSPPPSPGFKNLFADEASADDVEGLEDEESTDTVEVDLTETGFPELTKTLEAKPHNIFNDPEYYKKSLSGEGEAAKRLHGIIQKFITAKDPKDKGVYRQQIITAYWDFLSGIARKATGKLLDSKRFLLRFGILHPTFLNQAEKTHFARIVIENELSLPIYYLDEWFKAIGTGNIKNSTTDEVRVAKSNKQHHLKQLLDKAEGKREGTRNLLKAKSEERGTYEKALLDKTRLLTQHSPVPGLQEINSVYSEGQKHIFSDIQELLKNMIRADRELESFIKDYAQAQEDVNTLTAKVKEEGADVAIDIQAVDNEIDTVRQMAKLTIGRQGNHFPILSKDYFRSGPNDIATRENVLTQLAWIESIDKEAFCRHYKNKLNRIVPYVILIPSYGDQGVCWEPFDRFNRATSRGRIAIPMFPKNLPMAILAAVADLRWQVAKEKASYYWMEEGLTGNYYQWFVSKKLKGDVKEYFIQDYIVWMTKESDGIQKLDKEMRGIFWRYIPFTQEIKEKLKTRSYVYQELYQRDVNRSMSDGY